MTPLHNDAFVQIQIVSVAPYVPDASRAAFQATWGGVINTTPSSSDFYFPNVLSTAFTNHSNPSYLFDLASLNGGTASHRRAAIVKAMETGQPVASPKLAGATAVGVRVGVSTDIFIPLFPGAVNASGARSRNCRSQVC